MNDDFSQKPAGEQAMTAHYIPCIMRLGIVYRKKMFSPGQIFLIATMIPLVKKFTKFFWNDAMSPHPAPQNE
jgi:hypothetical protein